MTSWAYGVTTTVFRRDDLLPKTMASLEKAGFDRPWLFVDGDDNPREWRKLFPGVSGVTVRDPKIRTYGNWILSLAELYIREPSCQHYALFQDDLLACQGLRAYLDRSIPKLPERSYLNLYLFNSNYVICPRTDTGKLWSGWYKSNQFGRGALALAFSREAVVTLLSSKHMAERPIHADRGWRAVDGGIVTAMNKADPPWWEYVHHPGLTQHTGRESSMGSPPHRPTPSFIGEHGDLSALPCHVFVKR